MRNAEINLVAQPVGIPDKGQLASGDNAKGGDLRHGLPEFLQRFQRELPPLSDPARKRWQRMGFIGELFA